MTPRRIIIHHTAGNSLPNPNPYHFVVDFDGRVHTGIPVTQTTGATRNNNEGSIMIAALGNWVTENMSTTQQNGLVNAIANTLNRFPSIVRQNRFNLPASQMHHLGQLSRQELPVAQRRHQNSGIKGHEDGLGEATLCPGARLYNLCRDTLVIRAINLANSRPNLQ